MPFNLLTTTGEIQLDDTLLGASDSYSDGKVLGDWNPFTAPTFNDRSTEFLWDWGASGGHDTVGTRKLKWTVFIRGTSMADMMVKVQELSYRMSPASVEKELCFYLGSEGFTYFGRPRGLEIVRLDPAHFYAWCECRWEALDPRYYSNTTVTVTNASASLSIPYAVPPQATLQTASAPTPWQMIIRPNAGTTIQPVVTHPDLVWNIRYDNLGVAIASGKELYLDSRKRTSIHRNANGTAPDKIDNLMDYTNVWFDLPAWQLASSASQTTRAVQVFKIGGTAATYTLIFTYRKCFI